MCDWLIDLESSSFERFPALISSNRALSDGLKPSSIPTSAGKKGGHAEHFCDEWLPRVMKVFQGKFPNIEFEISDNTGGVRSAKLGGCAPLLFCTHSQIPPAEPEA